MDLKEAGLKNLDVYMFPADAVYLQESVHLTAQLAGREAFKFTDNIGTTTVICVAVGPRPNAGQIARDMKARRKTPRQFIQEE